MKHPILISLILITLNFSYSQDKKVFIKLDRKKYQQPKYTFYDNDKTIVYYTTYNRLEKKDVEFYGSLKCYNMKLEEIWSVNKFDVLKINYKNERKKYFSIFKKYTQWDIRKTNSPDYSYIFNLFERRISLINTKTGKIDEIKLPNESILDNSLFDYNLFIEGNHVYFVYKKQNIHAGLVVKESLKVDIFDYDISKKTGKIKSFDILSLGKTKDLLTNKGETERQWIINSFINGKICFIDAFSIQTKDAFFKRVLAYNLDGQLIDDHMVKLGTKIADNDMSCELYINPFNDNASYSFSIDRTDGINYAHYCKYDENFKLVWEKKYDSKIKNGSIQKIMTSSKPTKTYDGNIRFISSYGNNIDFLFLVDKADEMKFKRLESSEKSLKYPINNVDYNIVSLNSKSQNFVDDKIKNTEEHHLVNTLETNNSIIILETPYSLLITPHPYIGLYLFKK